MEEVVFIPLSLSPQDVRFIEERNAYLRKIALAFAIPRVGKS